jgi:hypothetical protein
MLKVAVALLLFASPAFAKHAPSAQGKACGAREKCDEGLSCIASGDGKSTCQLACDAKTKCPEDQRCVKDNGHSICRPINDADL